MRHLLASLVFTVFVCGPVRGATLYLAQVAAGGGYSAALWLRHNAIPFSTEEPIADLRDLDSLQFRKYQQTGDKIGIAIAIAIGIEDVNLQKPIAIATAIGIPMPIPTLFMHVGAPQGSEQLLRISRQKLFRAVVLA